MAEKKVISIHLADWEDLVEYGSKLTKKFKRNYSMADIIRVLNNFYKKHKPKTEAIETAADKIKTVLSNS